MLNERARLLLKFLVERYIEDGQPVGSRTLSKHTGLNLSPASIRNVMSDLEEGGFITSPHTSAGRVPNPPWRPTTRSNSSTRLPTCWPNSAPMPASSSSRSGAARACARSNF